MIEALQISRVDIAKSAGISIQQLNNAVSKSAQVLELKDGGFVLIAKNSTIFPNKISRVSDEKF